MRTFLLVVGFAWVLWEIRSLRMLIGSARLELLELRYRQANLDQRISKRLYDLTHLLNEMEERLYDVNWAVAPLAMRPEKGAISIRETLAADREKRIHWVEEPSDVIPSDYEVLPIQL